MPTDATTIAPDVGQRMATFNRAISRLIQDQDDLTAQYPNHWVAVGAEGIIDNALTSRELAQQLRDAGVPNHAVVTRFLNAEPKVLIL